MLQNKKRMVTYFMIAIFCVAADRFFKAMSLLFFQNEEVVLSSFLKFNFTRNYNIAFSIPLFSKLILVVVPVILLFLILYFIISAEKGKIDLAGLLIIISFCAASNYYDRLRYGFVIDYFDIKWFTVLNLADIAIVMSTFIILIFYNKLMIK